MLEVARLMRDRGVGSVVICDPEGAPAAMVTDRDVTVRVAADDRSLSEPAGEHASRPLITVSPRWTWRRRRRSMVQHRVRRLPIVDGGEAGRHRHPRRHRRPDRATWRLPNG